MLWPLRTIGCMAPIVVYQRRECNHIWNKYLARTTGQCIPGVHDLIALQYYLFPAFRPVSSGLDLYLGSGSASTLCRIARLALIFREPWVGRSSYTLSTKSYTGQGIHEQESKRSSSSLHIRSLL